MIVHCLQRGKQSRQLILYLDPGRFYQLRMILRGFEVLQKTQIMRKFRECRKLLHFHILTRDFNFHRRMEWDIISSWLQATVEEKVCDIGCADGFYARKLVKQGCNALGIELDKEVVRLARRHRLGNRIGFVIGDARRLPIKSESLDKVILVSVLEHIHNDEYTLKEIARVLKPRGYLVMSVDSLSHVTTSNLIREKHRRRHLVETFYTISNLRRKLKRNGLKLERGQYILNSRISNLFLNLRHAHITFPIAYPLSKISDRLFGSEEGGAMLVVKAWKNNCKECIGE